LVYIYPPVKLGVDSDPVIFGSNKYRYKVGFVGRIAKEKGLQYLLGSIKYLHTYLKGDVAIYIAGPGEEVIGGGHKKEIASLLAKYSKSIFLLGTLSDAQLTAFYKMLDVFVLPSVERMESFGMTQVEAMLSGCPVVVNNLPGAREAVLKTGMGEVVNVKNPERLAKMIAKVARERNRYLLSRQSVEKLFNIKNTIEAYEKLISH
jgi:glycosyltransferase involved in cell wall biosynthesis